jgi:hypothetical protein
MIISSLAHGMNGSFFISQPRPNTTCGERRYYIKGMRIKPIFSLCGMCFAKRQCSEVVADNVRKLRRLSSECPALK